MIGDLREHNQEHAIAARHVYDDFTRPRSELLFYSADGHPTAEGHAVLSHATVRELIASGTIAGCSISTVTGEKRLGATNQHH